MFPFPASLQSAGTGTGKRAPHAVAGCGAGTDGDRRHDVNFIPWRQPHSGLAAAHRVRQLLCRYRVAPRLRRSDSLLGPSGTTRRASTAASAKPGRASSSIAATSAAVSARQLKAYVNRRKWVYWAARSRPALCVAPWIKEPDPPCLLTLAVVTDALFEADDIVSDDPAVRHCLALAQ